MGFQQVMILGMLIGLLIVIGIVILEYRELRETIKHKEEWLKYMEERKAQFDTDGGA